MDRIRRPLTRADAIALLALFVAIGGTATAVQTAATKNSVGSRELAKNAVKKQHIKRNQVTRKHIKRDQVRTRHVKTNQIGTGHIQDGAITGGKLAAGAVDSDAETLDGIDSSGFLTTDRVLYGRAPASDDETLLFELTGAGLEVRTHDAGEGDSIFDIRLRNTNDPNGAKFWVTDLFGSGSFNLAQGQSRAFGSLSGASLRITENNGPLGRMLLLQCFANVIAGGDDNQMVCTGITSG